MRKSFSSYPPCLLSHRLKPLYLPVAMALATANHVLLGRFQAFCTVRWEVKLSITNWCQPFAYTPRVSFEVKFTCETVSLCAYQTCPNFSMTCIRCMREMCAPGLLSRRRLGTRQALRRISEVRRAMITCNDRPWHLCTVTANASFRGNCLRYIYTFFMS